MYNKCRNVFAALLLTVLFSGNIFGQHGVQNLVFEGAGIRGIAYAGAITELEHRDMLAGVKRVGGTSAGAITAMAIAIGYSASELATVINSTSYKKFNDGRFLVFGGMNRLNRYYGWYRGRQVERWLGELMQYKTGDPDITFEELKQRGYRDLYVTGTSITQQRSIVFSHETHPRMRVIDAVRISLSIPLYFEAVFITPEGQVVRHPRSKEGLDVMIDGGIIANFPIRMFDSSRYMGDPGSNSFRVNSSTIGFRIDREEQIRNDDSAGNRLAGMATGNFPQYLQAFYNLIMESLNRQKLTPEDWQRSVSISDGNLGPRIRKLRKDEIDLLFRNGQEATRAYLSERSPKADLQTGPVG
ncbi:MAG TPA: patatin-like phospholipase family protein, partial [Flavisolibacter sp.]